MPGNAPANFDILLDKARGGDVGARNSLLTDVRRLLRAESAGRLHRAARGRCDTSDVVNQSLVEIDRGLPRFLGSAWREFLGWVRRINDHNIIDAGKRARAPMITLTDNLVARGESPSEGTRLLETEVTLRATLAQLPEEDRQVITLRTLEGREFAIVAEIMKSSEFAVRRRHARAMEKWHMLVCGDRR